MPKPRRKYSQAEKLEIVKQSMGEDVLVDDLADRYGLNPHTIYNWRSQFYKSQGLSPSGQGVKQMSDTEREIAELKKQLKEARLERDILKKAISIFSKGDGKSTDS